MHIRRPISPLRRSVGSSLRPTPTPCVVIYIAGSMSPSSPSYHSNRGAECWSCHPLVFLSLCARDAHGLEDADAQITQDGVWGGSSCWWLVGLMDVAGPLGCCHMASDKHLRYLRRVFVEVVLGPEDDSRVALELCLHNVGLSLDQRLRHLPHDTAREVILVSGEAFLCFPFEHHQCGAAAHAILITMRLFLNDVFDGLPHHVAATTIAGHQV
mmetsp:Transcript_9541/g.23362  ORF Transcript_9541/g.23362 Transcript_9541/m.23362 type:complete len:213 (-) Transcript_9541:692-1330(-)